MDRLASNAVTGNRMLQSHGAKDGRRLPKGVPDWQSAEFAYQGAGEVPDF